MPFLKTYKFPILFLLLFSAVYFFLRLYNIMSLPIFTDEAIYVRWSQIARFDPNWRFISLTDGKQPSFVWATMIIMRFLDDPLLAGRLTSVFAGFFGMLGMYFLGREIFKNAAVGIFSALLYLLFPMSLVYDRMALYDSLVTMFFVWSTYFTILLVRRIRLDVALILGMIIGGGVLTKTSNFFSIYLLPFSLILFDFKKKNMKGDLLRLIFFFGISVALAYGFYSVLRLSPLFHIIEEKNSIFVYPISEWLMHPFEYVIGNLRGLLDWFFTYLTFPILVLIFSTFIIDRKLLREKLLLLVYFLAPFCALAIFGKTLYPRFIFFMVVSLLPLGAYSLNFLFEKIKNKWLFALFLFIFLSMFLRADYYILNDFQRAPIPRSDLEQYINGWPAGGGIKEMVEFFRNEAKDKKIYVATEGTFGSLPTYSMEIYLDENKNIEKKGFWPIQSEIPQEVLEKSREKPTYFVFYQQVGPENWPLTLLKEYRKGLGDSMLRIYRVEPQ